MMSGEFMYCLATEPYSLLVNVMEACRESRGIVPLISDLGGDG